MPDADPRADGHDHAKRLTRAVDTKAPRKLAARRGGPPPVLAGLGVFGLVGWSVAVPTVLGALLGAWLDAQGGSQRSWTLALLVGGLTLGCLNALAWIGREHRAMQVRPPAEDEEADDD